MSGKIVTVLCHSLDCKKSQLIKVKNYENLNYFLQVQIKLISKTLIFFSSCFNVMEVCGYKVLNRKVNIFSVSCRLAAAVFTFQLMQRKNEN